MTFKFSEIVKLVDGTEVALTSSSISDLDETLKFYQSFPDSVGRCLLSGADDKEVLLRRYAMIDKNRALRIIASIDGKIIGEAGIESMRYGWLRRSGEVHIALLPKYVNTGLAAILGREIFFLAARFNFKKLIARVTDQQKEEYNIFMLLHFTHAATQKAHAIDTFGNMHDVHLLMYDLGKMWADLEDALTGAATRHKEN